MRRRKSVYVRAEQALSKPTKDQEGFESTLCPALEGLLNSSFSWSIAVEFSKYRQLANAELTKVTRKSSLCFKVLFPKCMEVPWSAAGNLRGYCRTFLIFKGHSDTKHLCKLLALGQCTVSTLDRAVFLLIRLYLCEIGFCYKTSTRDNHCITGNQNNSIQSDSSI